MRRKINKTQEGLRRELVVKRDQRLRRQPCTHQMQQSGKEEKKSVCKIIIKYSWSAWIVLKLFIKLSTYSMLKSNNREEEAYKWITDWGPFFNPFIEYVFHPSYKVIMYFLNYKEQIFETFSEPPIAYLMQDILDNLFCSLHCATLNILFLRMTLYRAIISVDLGTLVLIVLFCLSFIVIFCFCWKIAAKKRKQQKFDHLIEELAMMYRKDPQIRNKIETISKYYQTFNSRLVKNTIKKDKPKYFSDMH